MQPILIALDTAWGSRHGGINAFNTELLKALGIQPDRLFEVICVLLNVDAEIIEETQRSYQLRLLSLGVEGGQLLPDHAAKVIACLR